MIFFPNTLAKLKPETLSDKLTNAARQRESSDAVRNETIGQKSS